MGRENVGMICIYSMGARIPLIHTSAVIHGNWCNDYQSKISDENSATKSVNHKTTTESKSTEEFNLFFHVMANISMYQPQPGLLKWFREAESKLLEEQFPPVTPLYCEKTLLNFVEYFQ